MWQRPFLIKKFRLYRSSPPEVFLGKCVLKICSKFTGQHPCRSVISIKLHSNFIKIALRHGCSPVNLLHISEYLFLRTPLTGCFWLYKRKKSVIVVLLAMPRKILELLLCKTPLGDQGRI